MVNLAFMAWAILTLISELVRLESSASLALANKTAHGIGGGGGGNLVVGARTTAGPKG